MPDPIRVRDDVLGHEYSTYGVDENGKPDKGLTRIDEPAVDDRGDLLPPKYPAAPKPQAPKAADTTGPKATTKES